jgi:UDP-N-acetylmuramate dehydrogenase
MIDNLCNIGIANEPMKNHTSFKIGGTADLFITIKTVEELKNVLQLANKTNQNITIIGNGSNLLVKDNGIRGIVLKIDIKKFEIEEKQDEVFVTVGSGEKLGEVAIKLCKNEISGFEELSGIPGTFGGAIRMNAGAYGIEMKDIVVSSTYMDMNGKIYTISNAEHYFEYRNSMFSKERFIILETCLRLKKGNAKEINQKMQEYLNLRKEKQPIEFPSAGSTFKRGTDFITAKLIDECGLKGYKIGGAEISTKHAGFIINTGNATAKDVIDLIEYTKRQVYDKFQKNIETEVEIIGE